MSRSPLSGGGYAEIAHTNGTSFVDRAAKPGTTYGGRHWVYSDADDMTITASSDTTAPPAPTVTVDWSASALTPNWAATGSDTAEYRIYRGDRSGTETPLATVSGTSYVDDEVSTGNTYYYVVRAVDQHLNISAPSAETLVWTPTNPLAAGTYSVTVDHVISEPAGGTGSEIAKPYTTTVTIS